jgi:hypothetical protein
MSKSLKIPTSIKTSSWVALVFAVLIWCLGTMFLLQRREILGSILAQLGGELNLITKFWLSMPTIIPIGITLLVIILLIWKELSIHSSLRKLQFNLFSLVVAITWIFLVDYIISQPVNDIIQQLSK